MALIICPECGQQVSDKAEICPHCGIKIAGNIIITQGAQPIYTQNTQQSVIGGNNMTGNSLQGYDKSTNVPPTPQSPKKKSHTIIIISFIIALLICGGVFYMYNSAQKERECDDYEQAMNSNDIEVMQMYLARYGDAPAEHRDSVNARLAQFTEQDNAWTNAVVSGSKKELEKYIADHPDSPHKGQAMNMIDSIDFAIADRQHNLESYKIYLQQHPDGKYASKAQDFIDEKQQTEVQPEELTMAKTTCRKFLQAINSHDANRLLENVADFLDSFLNRSGASSTDVVNFMNKLYKDDITNMNWHILDDFKAEKVASNDGYNIKVQFSAEQKIERTDATKEKYNKYIITAEINQDGKITSFNMKKQTVAQQ